MGELIAKSHLRPCDLEFRSFSSPPREPRRHDHEIDPNFDEAARAREWRVLSKKIQSVEMVPELQARENRHEQVTLNPHEWMIITRIDGQRSIADIGHVLNMSSFDVAKILYGLITGELVHLKKKPERSADEENTSIRLAARLKRRRGSRESAHRRSRSSSCTPSTAS